MEVVFTLLAERYQERGGVLMTSNLPFSKWEAIFKDASDDLWPLSIDWCTIA